MPYSFPNNFGGYVFPWQLPQVQTPQPQAANPVNANIDAIWAGGYPRSMFAPQPQAQQQPQITPQAQAYMNLTPQGASIMPDDYSLAGLLSGMGGDGSGASVTGGPTAAYAPAQGGNDSGSKYAQQRISADGDATTDNVTPQQVAAPNITPNLGTLGGSAPQHWQGDAPLGGTYDGDTGATSWLGGLISYTPQAGQSDLDRQRMASAALQDAAQWFGGKGAQADSLQTEEARQLQMQQMQRGLAARASIAQQLQDAKGDPAKTRAALVNAALLGLNSGELTGALGYGTPTYKGYDRDQNVYAIDPTTGRPIAVLQKGADKPVVAGGMLVQPDTGRATAIPGYLSQQLQIASAKARARAEANAEFKTPGTNAAVNIAHPSTGY